MAFSLIALCLFSPPLIVLSKRCAMVHQVHVRVLSLAAAARVSVGRNNTKSSLLLYRRRHHLPVNKHHSTASRARSLFYSTTTTTPATPATVPTLDSPPAISKVLVANRGEIACRVLRTCRRWGIPTVALYSVADGPNALHARMADEAYPIGIGPTPSESYLRQDDVLDIALTTGATAIHPGYGFLSENANFCDAVVQRAGLTFVGPPATAIQAMGSKSESKAIMEQAGVPTTPGYYEPTATGKQQQDPHHLLEQAKQIGFPVLIKAVMGGGGKGMRLVWKTDEFLPALEACQSESLASFGDATVLLEKYLVRPRHVEVQVVADQHGNVVHLHERDCSLQRRHQKIIEEAPASDLDVAIRQRLGEMGKKAAQAVGYVNAGTVEFLLDTQEPENFYFCEMNTRLQVEHPITEMITGMDLVEWQLRIAAGEELPIKNQDDIPCHGHAFEARIYAENPARNFLPATGNLWHHRPPAIINADDGSSAETGVRVDTGLQSGQDVSVYYDPMISKLIVHDQDRTKALTKLVRALKDYQIGGVPTNIDFLIKCAQHPVFGQAGKVNTGFLEDYADDVRMEEIQQIPALAQTIGAYAIMLYLEHRIGTDTSRPVGPWSSRSGSWRMGGESGRARKTLTMEHGEKITCVSNRDGSFDVLVHDYDDNKSTSQQEDESRSCYHVSGTMTRNGNMEVLVNGTRRIELKTVLKVENEMIHVRMWPVNLLDHYAWELNVEHPMVPKRSDHIAAGGEEGIVKAPMPGRIRRVLFKEGQAVKAAQVVMVMEAMKMEHSILAPRDGVLTEICYDVDDVVRDGAILLVVDGGEDEGNEVDSSSIA